MLSAYRTPQSIGRYRMAHHVGKSVAKTLFQSATRRRQTPSNIRRNIPNVIRQQADKSSRKTKGRKKVKSIVHRKKRVKVSRVLRKKIKKVIAGTDHYGTYMATRQGTVGVITTGNSDTDYVTQNQGGYIPSIIATKLPRDLQSNTRFWFGGGLSGNNDFANGNEYQFFTPLKFLDAASILWNQKTAAEDYTIQTGNLNTVHNQTTGSLVTGTVSQMEIVGLKINIKNAYVKQVLKNNSQRSMGIEIYKCVPKTRNPLETPLATFVDSCDREVDGTNSALYSIVGGLSLARDNAVAMPGIEPNAFKAFNSEWKYEKVTIKLAPGETTTLFHQGPKQYLLDYDKLNKGVQNVQHLAFKQTTMQLMIAITPDLAFGTANVTPNLGATGRFIANVTALNTISLPISIETTEVIKLSMPDIVGFQNGPATDAGNMYTLNKRIERKAYANFGALHVTESNAGYTAFEEENPVTGIVSSRFS